MAIVDVTRGVCPACMDFDEDLSVEYLADDNGVQINVSGAEILFDFGQALTIMEKLGQVFNAEIVCKEEEK